MKEILALQNKWWETKSVPQELLGDFKRDIFIKLTEDIKEKKITSILGPRRAGKTILMHQLIEHLLDNGADAKRILYLQFDVIETRKPGIIKELIMLLTGIIKEPLDELNETIYLFLDEIHKVEKWEEEIKQFQDMKLKIKFVVSGSSSLRILKGSGESLIGRINHFLIMPLNFKEFLSLKGIKVEPIELDTMLLKKTYAELSVYINKINLYFMEYLQKGGYPELITKNVVEAYRLLVDYKDLSLQRDLFELEGVRDSKSIKDLLSVLASLASERINYSKLASILGIKADTVKRYIGLLEDIYLINEAKIFSRKPYFSVRKERKIFFIDNGLLNAINMKYDIDEAYTPKLIENICASAVFGMKSKSSISPEITYWLDEFGKEIDLIMEKEGEVIPVEIKFRNQILKKDIFTLKKFLKRFRFNRGIVITKDYLDRRVTEGKEILFIPAWLFLLIG